MTEAQTKSVADNDVSSIVESSLQRIKNIATLPVVALKIMRLTEDPETTANDVNEVIKSDPALSIRILKVVNSSFYGLPRQIDSIHRAILLLGLNPVKNIAIAASVHKVFKSERISPHFDARDFMTHSIAVAAGARGLALRARLDSPDEAFLAGLIHDVGVMVEMQASRHEFTEMIGVLTEDQNLTFRQAEEQILGANHEAFGAGLLNKWTFPMNLEQVAGYHHRPMELPDDERTLPAIVHAADVLAMRIGVGYSRTVEIDEVDPELLSSLGLAEADMQAVAETLPEAIEEAQQLFSDDGT